MVAFWQQLSWTRTIRWSLASSVSYSLLVDRRLSNSFSSKNSTFPENSVHLRSKKRHAYILNLKSTCLLIYWVCMRIKVIPADFKISYRINFSSDDLNVFVTRCSFIEFKISAFITFLELHICIYDSNIFETTVVGRCNFVCAGFKGSCYSVLFSFIGANMKMILHRRVSLTIWKWHRLIHFTQSLFAFDSSVSVSFLNDSIFKA